MATNITTKDVGKLVLPAENLPVILSVGIRGATHEGFSELRCGANGFREQHNAFKLQLGRAHALYGQDLAVRTRIQDVDPEGDEVTYIFMVQCGMASYSYEKSYVFQPVPQMGQWVRFNTVVSFRQP